MLSRELDNAKKERLESLHRQWEVQHEKRSKRPLPFKSRIQLAVDIRNHQGDPNQFFSKCEFYKLIADIWQVYHSTDPFYVRVYGTVTRDKDASGGSPGAAVLDLYSVHVYALLFDTKQNEFYLSLDAKQKGELEVKCRVTRISRNRHQRAKDFFKLQWGEGGNGARD